MLNYLLYDISLIGCGGLSLILFLGFAIISLRTRQLLALPQFINNVLLSLLCVSIVFFLKTPDSLYMGLVMGVNRNQQIPCSLEPA